MDTAHQRDYKYTPGIILAIELGAHGGPQTNINMYSGSLIPLIIGHKIAYNMACVCTFLLRNPRKYL